MMIYKDKNKSQKTKTSSIFHLIKRWAVSLSSKPPSNRDLDWVRLQLSPLEYELWSQMSNQDKRHTISVAHKLRNRLDSPVPSYATAAALLHDIGKIRSNLGTNSRVLATLIAGVLGRDQVSKWKNKSGFLARVGLYIDHGKVGSELLRAIGSSALTISWTNQHHDPLRDWQIKDRWAIVLKDCDGD